MQHISILQKTIEIFKKNTLIPKAHQTAQKKYTGIKITAGATRQTNVPFPGKKDERNVSGGVKSTSIAHGLIRYEYKGNIIQQCRKDGRENGLRVVCTQMGDIWIRTHKNGIRLAQLVLNADLSQQNSIDDGGLKRLKQNLHLIKKCFELKQ